MNKIKVIDLLNKIANGEEDIPKHILFEENNYYFDDCKYQDFYNEVYYGDLNSEIKIIEESKKLEKEEDLYEYGLTRAESIILDKVNEIIDYINKDN